MTVLIALTTAGSDSGPFDLYSNSTGSWVIFENDVDKSALVAGYTSNLVPNGTTMIRVQSDGVCTNYIDLTIVIQPKDCIEYLVTNTNDPQIPGGNITILYTDCDGLPGELELAPGAGGYFCAEEGSYILPEGGAINVVGPCGPVNCTVSEWSSWSTCVEDTSTRTRTIVTQPGQGGEACPPLVESKDCTNCEVSEFSDWSICDNGLQTRTRTVIIPAYNGGTECPALSETQTCSSISITGLICNDTDGGSTITKRYRISVGNAPANYTIDQGTVVNPAGLTFSIVPTPGDAYIQIAFKPAITYGNEFSIELLLKNSTGFTVGTNVTQTIYGNYQSGVPSCIPPPVVDCQVSEWSAWSGCVDNISTRTRTITTPASGGGAECPVLTESRDCANCEVSEWSGWSTCVDGIQNQTRTVITQPYNGGSPCPPLSDTRTCSGISIGSAFCYTDSNGTIIKKFTISINNPPSTYTIDQGTVVNPAGLVYSIIATPGNSYLEVAFKPAITYGNEFSIELLLKNSTGAVVGTNVTQTVNGDPQSYLPSCIPPPVVDCVVSGWSDWSACVGNISTRTRTVVTQASGGGVACPILSETRDCANCEVSEWSNWSACVDGIETQTRTVITQPYNGGSACPDLTNTRTCSGIDITDAICNDSSGGSTVTKRFTIALNNPPNNYTIEQGTVINPAGLIYSIVPTPGECYIQIEFKPALTYGNEFSIQLILKNSFGTVVGTSGTETLYGDYYSYLPSCSSTPVVNCDVSGWSAWSDCIDNISTRTRSVITPASGGGTECPTLIETRACANCEVSGWSAWSTCTDGIQTQTRTVITQPYNGGTVCPTLTQSRTCSGIDITSLICNDSDGGNTITKRYRIALSNEPSNYTIDQTNIINPAALVYSIVSTPGNCYIQIAFKPALTYGGEFSIQLLLKNSSGVTVGMSGVETMYGDYQSGIPSCIPVPVVDCVVSGWSAWSSCTNNQKSRTRTIITPASGGGASCPTLIEYESCTNCEVSAWSAWSACVDGFQTQTRTVITAASNGGTACPVLSQTRTCSGIDITDAFCNTDSGSTVTKRFRITLSDAPSNYTIAAGTIVNPAGLTYSIVATPGDCYIQIEFRPSVTYGNEFSIQLLLKNSSGATVGISSTETMYGNYYSYLPSCFPVNCVVSAWSAYSSCVDGYKTRTRTITTQPYNGGEACPALSETVTCPVDCVVSDWSAWSTCSDGLQTHTRTVITPALNGGASCPVLSETRGCSSIGLGSTLCNTDGGSTITKKFRISLSNEPSNYTIIAGTVVNPAGLTYSIVATPGDSYLQVEFRPSVTYGNEFSIQLILKNSSGTTVGVSSSQTVYGNYQSYLPGCYPVNCQVSGWSDWSACVNGSQTRTRTIITQPTGGGTACPPLSETQSCTMPVNCTVSEWSDWSTCFDGFQSRTRTVITPASGGGNPCPPLIEYQECVMPVNCQVSAWSDWSTCIDGSQTRTRSVITPASGGGTPCPALSESQSCTVSCYPYDIAYGTTANNACVNYSNGTVLPLAIDTPDWLEATFLYRSCSILLPRSAGWYSSDGRNRYWDGSEFTSGSVCIF